MLPEMNIKTAILNADANALRRLLSEDSTRANALIPWGTNDCIQTHPLHYVSDMLFEGKLQKGHELPLIDALIHAGANLDFQKNGKGDTPLIGAASLAGRRWGSEIGGWLVGIPITNTSVNPARSIGPALFVGGWALQQLWMFIVAPFVGAVVAAVVYAGLGHPSVLITTKRAEQALIGEQIDRIA